LSAPAPCSPSADGWLTLEERRKMTQRFCAIEDLSIFGPDEALEAFDRLIDLFDRDPALARSDAEAAVAKLRGHSAARRWWRTPAASQQRTGDLMRRSGILS
jgi:tellurite resistance protein